MVSAKEEPDAPIPSSMDALLRIHRRILGLDSDYDHTTAGASGGIITRLLVADSQAGSLIGRRGSTIKSIQDASNCIVRVIGGEGEPTCVHAAVELIASHLRNFLVHHSIIGVFEVQMQMQNERANQNMIMPQSQHHLHGFLTHADSGAHVGSKPQYMRYEPHDLLLYDENSYLGLPVYGKHASMGGHSSNVQAK
ncbi:hypothetical protein V6N12_058896 [Hibiscus sabdariffa]|uniref:K Homology domain-containing protein n=1 Tax=Hibiscus sabdariffa TaxID=183260 RepID=A0ABR2ETK3_9ROSI